MLNTRFKSSLVAISVATILSACGGSSGGAPASSTPTNVTASGAVERIGSVIINGVRYETENSQIVSVDNPAEVLLNNPTTAQLEALIGPGNIIKVRGTRTDDTNGTANTITIDNELVGTISSIDPVLGTFVVLGQTIFVSPDTIIDDSIISNTATADAAFGTLNTTLDTLLASVTTVEISGLPTQDGFEATRIEDVDTSATAGTDDVVGESEVKGFVKSFDTPVGTFKINDLTIDFSALSIVPTLANGALVEVKGNVSGTTLTATSIELEDRDDLIDDDFNEGEVEVEGIIQTITPTSGTAGTILVQGIEFTVADISRFQVGTRIEIKAQLQNGNLQVIRIEDETEDNVRVEDMATGPADGNGVITTRLGIKVDTGNQRTRLEDEENLLPGNVTAGTHVEARGFLLNDETVWTRVEVSNDVEARCRLRAPVESFDLINFTITIATSTDVNENVEIDASNTLQFRDGNGTLISNPTDFFALLSTTSVVQATSDDASGCTDGTLVAKQVSIELGDDVLENGADDNGAGDDDGADNELKGAVSAISAGGSGSFTIAGETISFDGNTLIDDSLIEDFRNDNVELANDAALASLNPSETLDQLLTDGTIYVVTIDRSGSTPLATLIEDFD